MKRMTLAALLAGGLVLAGCAEMGVGMPGRTATQESLSTVTATVVSVDQTTRRVTLQDEADGVFTVVAGPAIRNLPQLAAGDVVQMDFYQATTVAMASPDDSGAPATAVLAGRAPEGAKPGAVAVVSNSLVVTLTDFDSSTGLATFRTPDGFTRRAIVPPNLRNFAGSLSRGARVVVTLTDATAVTITETAAS